MLRRTRRRLSLPLLLLLLTAALALAAPAGAIGVLCPGKVCGDSIPLDSGFSTVTYE